MKVAHLFSISRRQITDSTKRTGRMKNVLKSRKPQANICLLGLPVARKGRVSRREGFGAPRRQSTNRNGRACWQL
jgi:hypothetical protein